MAAILPSPARAKLIAISGAADDARAAAANAHNRIADLQKTLSMSPDNPPEDAAAIEIEIHRLRSVWEKSSHRHSELASLAASIHLWLQRLPPGTQLHVSKVVSATKAESFSTAIPRVRAEITATQQELRKTKVAAPPTADLKIAMRAEVDRLAAKGRPTVAIAGGALKIGFESDASFGPLKTERIAEFLAWLDPAALKKRLEGEIDALPEPANTLSATDKDQRLGSLAARLDELERREEAMVSAALAEGIDVLRRPSASPAAVLGVEFKTKPARVRLAG